VGAQIRILLVVNSLVQGGAQRFTVNFANELHALNHEVEILSFYPEETDFFQVDASITIHRFIHPFHDRGRKTNHRNRDRGWLASNILSLAFRVLPNKVLRVFWRISDLRQLRQHVINVNPDIVVAIESYVGVLIGCVVPNRTPIIVSERVHPAFHLLPRLWRIGQRIVYKRRNVHLHAQGEEIARYLHAKYEKPVITLPNIVLSVRNQIQENARGKVVLSFARYTPQKGIDLLLEAWSMVPENLRTDWVLKIYGDGDREPYLLQSKNLGISGSVEIGPAVQNTEEIYNKASIYVLPSRYEGFPNSLSEAMAHGMACIATNNPSAINDLTINGELARLVPIDSGAIAFALEELISDASERKKLGDRAALVSRFFEKTKVTQQWVDFFDNLLDEEAFLKHCNACGRLLKKDDLAELVHSNSLDLQLEQIWNIQYLCTDLVANNIASRYLCSNCGTSNFNMRSGTEDFYSACYRSTKYSRQDNWDYQRVVKRIGDQPDLNILDVGSGYSRFLDLVHNSKSKVSIVEIDEHVRSDQSDQIFSSFKDIDSLEGTFSVIHLSHLLEHVDNPLHYLSTLKKHLQKNGKIYVTVPNGGLTGVNNGVLDWPPHHVSRFTANGMKKLAKRCDLKITSIYAKFSDQDKLKQFDFMFELEASS